MFCEKATVWTPETMWSIIQRLTSGQLGIPITTRQWDYIDITLDCYLLQRSYSKIMGVSNKWIKQSSNLVGLDSDIDALNLVGYKSGNAGGDNLIHHLQTALIFRTNTTIYKNNLVFRGNLTHSLLAAFWKVSCSWYKLAKITANNSSKQRHSIENITAYKKTMIFVFALTVWKKI